jgi:hypothetical protein
MLVVLSAPMSAAGAAVQGSALRASGSATPSPVAKPTSVPAPASAPSTSEVTFGIQAAINNVGDQRPRFVYGGGPGVAPFKDEIALVNIGDSPLELDVYPSDAVSTADGQFAFALQHDTQNGIGSWITMQGPAKITVPARTAAGPSRVFVPFSLKIPATATPGDHVGAIFASLHTNADATSRASEALDQRVGIRVYVRVSGKVSPTLSIDHLKATYGPAFSPNPLERGKVSVSYVVRNSGNVILGANQRVSVSGLFGGHEEATGLKPIPALLPGSSVVVHTTIPAVFPEFRLTIKATLLPVVPVGDVDPGVKTTSVTTTLLAIPWSLLIVIIVLLLLLALVVRRWRKQAKRPGRHGPPKKRRDLVLSS